MRFRGESKKLGVVLSAFVLMLCMLVPKISTAGEIRAPLDEMISKARPGEKIKAIAILADRIDNRAMNQDLKDSKATLEQRHYEVITSLRQKATLTQPPVATLLQQLEQEGIVSNIKRFWITNVIAFEGTPEAIERIAALSEIEEVAYDIPVELIKPVTTGGGDEPVIATHSQGLDVMNVPAVWALGFTGAGRLVSNIDTGVDGTHPALSLRWRGNNGHPASECWYDPVGYTSYPQDYGEHGTHTMGTICGRSSTTYDTVGVAIDAQWIACASIDNGASTSDVIASFQFLADPDDNPGTMDDVPDAVGNSWGWSPILHGVDPCDNTFWGAMDACENAGVAVIFAAGNEGTYGASSLRTPADRASTYYNAFAVGAIDGHTAGYPIAYFSSLGPSTCSFGNMNIKPECVAPGVNVRSSVPGGGYESNWSGTSMACPHITGAVALIRQANPTLDVDSVKSIILQSCTDLGPTGEDNTYGHGYLNLLQAIQLASVGLGFVDGYVRDATYNTPLPATVSIPGTMISATANSQGYYFLTAPPETTYTITASYTGYGTDQASVYVIQDDTVSQDFSLAPPIISINPTSYNVSLPPGESQQRNLNISNTGTGTLYYSLSTETYNNLMLDNGQSIPVEPLPEPLGYRMPESDKPGTVEEPYYSPVITDQGGPDTWGHTWIDSDEPGGPSVAWVNISGSGTPVSLSDDSFQQVSIGFTFPFYNNNYTTLYITSNGMLTFGSGSTDYGNDNIPDTITPNNYIAPFWDDLSPQNGGPVLYYYDSANSRFIVSWLDVPLYTWMGGTGSLNFQAVLYPNGNIDFNYQTMNSGSGTLASSTIGIENYNGTDGLRIAYNQSYMHSSLSINIYATNWLTASPSSGSVPSGYSDVVAITFDASELEEGTYTGNINLTNNSPNNPDIDIPVTLHVTDIPMPFLQLNVPSITDTVYSGYTTNFTLQVSNAGDTTLEYSITDNRTWISESPTSGSISPGGTDNINVLFNASSLAPGNYTGQITVNSNDPGNPSIDVPVNLFVDLLITDDVGVSEILSPPDSMATGTTYPLRVEITNFGSESQTFDAVFEIRYEGSSNVLHADTLTITNMADSSIATYLFGSSFTPAVETTYVLVAYTTLSSDQVQVNNITTKNVLAYDMVSLWYGHLDGSPVNAVVGDTSLIDVYIQTPASAYIADMHLCLGADHQYVDSLVSDVRGQVYYPLTEWMLAEFTYVSGSPPNQSGWISQSFFGFARLYLALDENPWLHSETPLEIMSFAAKISDNEDLIGQTIPAIGPGLADIQGPSNASDTLGRIAFPLSEQFSELLFVETPSGCDFVPGDVNSDGQIIGSDVTYLVGYFRMINPPPPDSCWNALAGNWNYAAADANGDCQLIGSDVTYLVSYFRMLNEGPIWCPQTPPLFPPGLSDDRSRGGDGSQK